MNRPVHFELLADNPEELAAFYHEVFGWETNAWGGGEQQYWLVSTGSDGAGIDGGLMHRHFEQKVINTVEVPSIEQALQRIKAAGGTTVHGPEEIPGVGTHAYCKDPEGTLFGVMQPVER